MKLKIIFFIFAVLVKFSLGYTINKNTVISDSGTQVTFKDVTSTTGLRTLCSGLESYYSISYYDKKYLNAVGMAQIINSTIQSIPSNIFEKFTALTNFTASDVDLEEINRKD